MYFETEEMALTAYLRAMEFEVEKVYWREGACKWVFEDSDELRNAVTQFSGGEARVDPKKYNRIFSKMKSEMYQNAPKSTDVNPA